MRLFATRVFWLVLVVTQLATPRAGARAQHIIEVPQNRPAFTSEEADRWLHEVLPLVEEVAERTFQRQPPLKLINREQLIALRKQDWEAAQPAGGRNSAPSAGLYGDPARSGPEMYATLAAYRRRDATLYAIPTNVNLIRLPKGRRDRESLVKCVLAHELVHALQNQDGGSEAFLKTPDSWEELFARLALAEGQAEYVERQVGLRLGLDTSFLDAGDDAPADIESLIEPPRRGTGFYLRWIYRPGRAFVSEQCARGGMSRVWKMFQAPPSDMAMILHPERYAPDRRKLRDRSDALDAITQTLGKPRWNQLSVTVGPWWLEAHQPEMAVLTAEEKADLEQHVVACHIRLATDPSTFGYYRCTVYELKDAESAPIVLAIAEQARRRPRGGKDTKDSKDSKEGRREPIWAVFPFASASQGVYLVTFSGSYDGLKRAVLEAALRGALAKLNGEPPQGQSRAGSEPVIRLPGRYLLP